MSFAKLCVILSLVVGGTNSVAHAQAAKPAKVAVVHLKHFTTDLHAVKMALGFANEFVRQGASTTLLLSLEGVRLVDKNQPINLTWGLAESGDKMHGAGHGMGTQTIETMYESFVKAGGKVMACPHCAASAGCEVKRLREGAKFSGMDEMAAKLLEANVVLDY